MTQWKDDATFCYYCGLLTTEKDHVVPRMVLKMVKDLDLPVRNEIIGQRTLIVPACRECNSLLSSSYQDNLTERKRELKRRLKKRHKKLLKMPSWKEEEIDQLDPVLRQTIRASCEQKRILKMRLGW